MSDTRIKPLAGVRVVDLSRIVAGPYCTQQMADLGAEVIKVEPPGGDDTRRFGPPFLGDDATYYFSINRGKRSIAINLKNDAGKEIIYDLVRDADVVVENFRPGAAKRLGIDAETLRGIKPSLICVSISGYGAEGAEPWTTMPGYDLIIQGAGGIPSLTGPVEMKAADIVAKSAISPKTGPRPIAMPLPEVPLNHRRKSKCHHGSARNGISFHKRNTG